MNLYGFAGGDPINFDDPFGLCPRCRLNRGGEGGPQPGIIGPMLAAIGQAAENFWNEHGDAVVHAAAMIATRGMGGSRSGLRPDLSAQGPHTTFRVGPSGKITNYQTWRQQTNPQNPAPWESVKRVDVEGAPHYNKATKQKVPTPHVHEPNTPGGVRTARPDEIPKP